MAAAKKKTATAKKPAASTKKPAARDLGSVEDPSFMHQQREEDARDAKLGEASKVVKECHLLSKEAEKRLSAARLATSTPDAIEHDLERVVELGEDMATSAKEALRMLPR